MGVRILLSVLVLVLAGCAKPRVITLTNNDLTTLPSAAPPHRVIARALVSPDGRKVTVPVDTSGCVSPTLTATEAARTVLLTLSVSRSGGYCAGLATMGQAVVNLGSTLYGRTLVDGDTGAAIRYFDGRTLLGVRTVPSGFRFTGDEVGTLAQQPVLTPGGTTTWTRDYAGPAGAGELQITQSASAVPPAADDAPHGTVTINGRSVPVHGAVGYEILAFTVEGSGVSVSTIPNGTANRPVPLATLVRVAEGLSR